MSFWDQNHGIVFGDSIDGQFCIMTTREWRTDLGPGARECVAACA